MDLGVFNLCRILEKSSSQKKYTGFFDDTFFIMCERCLLTRGY